MSTTVVLGLGISGKAAAALLLKGGKQVLGVDSQPESVAPSQGMRVQSDRDEIDWSAVERLVVSPGISPHHPIYAEALKRKVPILGEAELALPQLKKPLLAITGTNGKTTVARLVEHVLNASGFNAKAVGNVGSPLCSYVMNDEGIDVFVVELSSFQLETMHSPVFDAGVLLNITPDHLDRYANMEEYAQAKCRLRQCMKEGAPLFVHQQVVDAFGHLLSKWEKIEHISPIGYRERGSHDIDIENALAAWSLCRTQGVKWEQFCSALETFRKPPHRIEFVRTVNGVDYYDDSKGTNIDAVIQAVKAMTGPVVLIAGGVDKGSSYLPWKEQLAERILKIVAIGEAAQKIASELGPYFEVQLADSLEAAVHAAAQSAASGSCVLLSPGCSSYDMFRDYAHRGQEFQRCVQSLE